MAGGIVKRVVVAMALTLVAAMASTGTSEADARSAVVPVAPTSVETGAPETGAGESGATSAVAADAVMDLPQVDVTSGYACAVHTDGRIACWGRNSSGEARPASGLYRSVSTAQDHSCGLHLDGSVACWGSDGSGQATPPSGSFVAVDAGPTATCAVRLDASLACWGAPALTVAPSGSFTSAAVGTRHACAVRTDETVTCWGSDADGRASPPTGTFRSVGAGAYQSCGLRTDGHVVCWGDGRWGQTDAPVGAFASLAVGSSTSCAVRADGSVACWGYLPAPVPAGAFASVSPGGSHSCGVRPDGTIECWGDETVAAAIMPPTSSYRSIVGSASELCALRRDATAVCRGADPSLPSVPDGPFTAIDPDDYHSCGLRPDGTIECWGQEYLGSTDAPPGAFRTMSAGLKNGCGVRLDSTVTCWGYDWEGKSTPPSGTFVDVSAGFLHTCGLRTDRHVACWGDPSGGVTDAPSGLFASISAGYIHSCGLRFDATVSCWGSDYEGSTSPPSGTFTSVEAGRAYSCGLRTDSTIACWGAGWNGRSTAPTGTYVSLSVGNDVACAVRTDGVSQCWGELTIVGDPFEPIVPPSGSGYHAVAPTRILDSRIAVGFSGKVEKGAPRTLVVTGLGGPADVPLDATSVVLNVTVTSSTAESFLTAFPTGSPVPTASNLNFAAGQTVPNLVTVPVGVGGQVDLATAVGATDVVADLVGYYDSGLGAGDGFLPLQPTRVLDSRTNTGEWGTPLAAGSPRDLELRPGLALLPPTATAVVANITVTGGTAPSYLTAWPSGETQPLASNLNLLPGQTIANLAVVKLGANGSVRFANAAGQVQVVVDLVGYFDSTAGARFHRIEPTRFLDTRIGLGLSGPQGPGQVRTVGVAGVAGTRVPPEATGLVANLTVADGTAETFVAVFPGGLDRPDPFSNLNAAANQVVPNLSVVGLGPGGGINVYNHLGSVALVGDAVGYFAPT